LNAEQQHQGSTLEQELFWQLTGFDRNRVVVAFMLFSKNVPHSTSL
jgi:hypothetical protein